MAWTGQTFTVGQILTAAQMNNLQADITALANGDVGSPSITQAAMGAASIGQAELKTALQQNSATLAPNAYAAITFTGGAYTMAWGAVSNRGTALETDGGSSYSWSMQLHDVQGSTTGTYYMQSRYMQASPMWDLGDGEFQLFVYAVMDNNSGKIIGYDISDAPPWAYNGPTDIRGKIKNGKKYRPRKSMVEIPFTYDEAKTDFVKLKEYAAAFAAADIFEEEVTQRIKNADMHLFPKPMSDKEGSTIVLLDPMSSISDELIALREHGEFNPSDILTAGHLIVDNTPLNRAGPPGVPVHGFRWR